MYEFYNNPIITVKILGNIASFNSGWTIIGFPEDLKPSN